MSKKNISKRKIVARLKESDYDLLFLKNGVAHWNNRSTIILHRTTILFFLKKIIGVRFHKSDYDWGKLKTLFWHWKNRSTIEANRTTIFKNFQTKLTVTVAS